MKLVFFKYNNKVDVVPVGHVSFGMLLDDDVVDLSQLGISNIFDEYNISNLDLKKILESNNNKVSINEISILPLKPNSLRDGYAFRQHVEAGRKSRGLDMIPEYDQFPVFYYGNHNAIGGSGEVKIQKEQSIQLDYELEIAAIIGKKGKNISVDEADDYIMGYTIMNDLSARALQKEEMKLNLGPAKGKDFLTTLGPYIITKDELEDKCVSNKNGNRYDLNMHAYLNGELLSEDNFKNITWTFAQIISRVSNGAEIFPGDVIGSGTCATGCLLELNQTNNTDIWLKDGDEIKLEVDRMGSLVNTIKFI